MIDEFLFHLACNEWEHCTPEVCWVSLLDEKIEFMAHMLAVKLVLPFSVELTTRPVPEEVIELLVFGVLWDVVELSDLAEDFGDLEHIVNHGDLTARDVFNEVLSGVVALLTLRD